MRQFILGLVMGAVLGGAGTAIAAGCGGNGFLMGWTVELDGEEICDSPFIWSGLRLIECD
jgi:hypothetical protein